MKRILAGIVLMSAQLALAGFASNEVYLASIGRGGGAGGAQFYSTLWVTNLSSTATVHFTFFFLKDGQSNLTGDPSFNDTLAPGQTKLYEDVTETKLSLPGQFGAARITADGEIFASERVYNLAHSTDNLGTSEGLFFAAVPKSFAIGLGDTASIQGVNQGSPTEDMRTNFDLVETTGNSCKVHVTLLDQNGTSQGATDVNMNPYGHVKLNAQALLSSVNTINGRIVATVTAGSGKVILAGEQLANTSQDSSGFEMSFKDSLISGDSGNCGVCVTSVNGLSGAVTIAAGSNVNVNKAGQTITISATGVGLTLPFSGTASTGTSVPAFSVTNTGTSSVAIQGEAGSGFGVNGQSTSGIGVEGTSDSNRGVFGFSSSGTGVVGEGQSGNGVVGVSASDSGVFGNSASGDGVYGTSGSNDGVHGEVNNAHAGVSGNNSGGGDGVDGSTSGTGASGVNGSATGSGGTGVFGSATGTNGFGVEGISTNSDGVHGEVDNAHAAVSGNNSGSGSGVYGSATGTNGYGVYGTSTQWDGVHGEVNSSHVGVAGVNTHAGSGFGIYGTGFVSGYFEGNVTVTGAISAGTKDFKIDHPLDPDNKYLVHASVESSEMKNLYDGEVTLDASGTATVTMPDWFSAENDHVRYQLTALGTPQPGLFISSKLQGNSFRIAGGAPGAEVSWQVTGVRRDAYARAHPLVVEEIKPEDEQGTYIHPELIGEPLTKSVDPIQRERALKAEAERNNSTER